MPENKDNNLTIWNQVEKTNPAFTKKFRRTGGFEGTAIDPLYNIYRATEMFGPIGIGWGYKILEEQILEGAPIKDKASGEIVGRDRVHEIKVELWYKHQGETGSLVASGATALVSSNKYGPGTDEEAVKKSLTDAISKGLSWLGFSADVHLGKFDDNKYVNGLKAEFTGESDKDKKPGDNKPRPQADELPVVDGVKFEPVTGRDGKKYIIAKGQTFQKKNILKNLGFEKTKNSSGAWVFYRPVQDQAA